MISKSSTNTLLSQTAEYALRAMVLLAEAGGGPLTTQSIAQQAKIPTGYLSKILRKLSKGGLLRAQRGIGGGFALCLACEKISALDVVTTVDGGVSRITACPLGNPAHAGLCPLHRMIDRATADVETALASTSLADLTRAERTCCRSTTAVNPSLSPPIEPGADCPPSV